MGLMHPGAWRNQLKKRDRATYDLTKYVTLVDKWYKLEAHPQDEQALAARLDHLRKAGLTVQLVIDNEDESPYSNK